MVPYVRKSFVKHFADGLKYIDGDIEAYNYCLKNKKDYSKKSIDDECFTSLEDVYKYALE